MSGEEVKEKDVEWFIVYYAHPKNIGVIRRYLSAGNKKYKIWQPFTVVEQYIKGKIKERQRPLFPGYLFVSFEYSPEVGKEFDSYDIKVLRQNNKPVILTPEQVAHYKYIEENYRERIGEFGLKQGDHVVIPSGNFGGITGVVTNFVGDNVIVEISFFKRKLPVAVSRQLLSQVII